MGSVERIDTGGFQEALDRISQARDAFRNSKEQIIASYEEWDTSVSEGLQQA